MEQFNLDKWLQDKSRKLCTRNGNIAEIIYTNGKGAFPVIVIDPYEEETEPWRVTENGKFFLNGDDDELDIFFADEEEELTEFEKELYALYRSIDVVQNYYSEEEVKYWVKTDAPKLFNLARKELKKSFVLLAKEDYQTAFDLGKTEALKEFPKLEKTKNVIDPTIPVMYTNAESMKTYVEYNGYRLRINDLFEKLPKEE